MTAEVAPAKPVFRVRAWLLAGALACGACQRQPPPLVSEPLRPLAGQGERRFVRLDPDATGLRFVNELLPENAYPYLNNGAGVAVGDVDGDGRPDVYLVSRDGRNALFLQRAPFEFVDATERAGVDGGAAWGSGASFVDIDGDGDLDLYVCNTESPNLLYVNRGDGQFDERAAEFGLDLVAACQMATFADYDRDGDLDVYIVTNRVFAGDLPAEIVADVRVPAAVTKTAAEMFGSTDGVVLADGEWRIPEAARSHVFAMRDQLYFGGQRDRLMRNDGGRFVDVTAESGIADQGMGLSATWWDFDGDGWLDLYVANDLESPDQLYRNLGSGLFEEVAARTVPHTAYYGMGSDAADLDNDGRLELMVADMSATSHEKSKMLMGPMGRRRWVLENARPPQYMRNAVFWNSGTPRLQEIAHLAGLASSDWTWAVLLADWDLDGHNDVFVTNGIPRFDMNPDNALRLAGAPRAQQVAFARRIAALPERNLAFRNLGDLRFEDVAEEWGIDHRGVSQGAAYGDMDRDGDLDLVVNNLNGHAWIYRNETVGAHRLVVRLAGRGGNSAGIGARVVLRTAGGVQVREVMPVRGYLSSCEPAAFFGLGTESRIEQLVVCWPSGVEQSFDDVPVDHAVTVTEPPPPQVRSAPAAAAGAGQPPWFREEAARLGLPFEHRERAFDDYALQPLLPHRLSRAGPGIAVADVDGDGADDVWVGGAAGQGGALYLHREGEYRRVDGPWTMHGEAEDMGAVFFDADADGALDLFVASGGIEAEAGAATYADRLYLGDGSGGFRDATERVPGPFASSSAVAAADFDRDGDVDLAVGGRVVPGRYPHAPPSRLLRNDGGRFTVLEDAHAPGLADAGMVTALLWADLDDDGWLDLIGAAHWRPLVWWRNAGDGGSLAAREALPAGTGWWNAVAVGDLDADGDLDLVATNNGENSKYHADDDHPALLYSADFDGNGVLDVIEAKLRGDEQLPVRGRSCSSAAMPFVAERFPTYERFAHAALDDIYSAAALAAARRDTASELRSGWLRNDGGGSFHWLPFERRVQVAPGFGVVVRDLDGDSLLDVFMAQNSDAPEPETGRMAGGLGQVLAGVDGGPPAWRGAAETGVVIAADASAAVSADLDRDGSPDLLVGINDGPVRVLRNTAASTRFFAVRLEGPPGNPTAIGARVTVQLAGGRQQVLPVVCGSGYLSAASPELLFGTDAQTVAEVRVRWPNGEHTVHRPAEGQRRAVLTSPSR